MRLGLFIIALTIFICLLAVMVGHLLRNRSYIAELASEREHHLRQAASAYEAGKPGLAEEHERTAAVLLERIARLKVGDETARIG